MTVELIKAESSDNDISPEGRAIVEKIAAQFPVKPRVLIYETIHGFIASVDKSEGTYPPADAGKPGRLDREDALFFAGLDGLRWFEVTQSLITVGIER